VANELKRRFSHFLAAGDESQIPSAIVTAIYTAVAVCPLFYISVLIVFQGGKMRGKTGIRRSKGALRQAEEPRVPDICHVSFASVHATASLTSATQASVVRSRRFGVNERNLPIRALRGARPRYYILHRRPGTEY
jgi:hypothetical protein